MPWYQQQLSIFTPMITSAIPPEPLISLLTNIPQVTFPICLKSDSLTGVSVGNLDNSWCGVTLTVETDGENWDLEISLGYYDLAQSLGTRSSGRTDTIYPQAWGSPWMLLTSLKNPCSVLNDQKKHSHSSWFLNQADNSDPCYSLVGVPTPENLTLWWEPQWNPLPWR